MSDPEHSTNPLIRKLATITCVVALLPIGMGALVTTLKAGMAFADWPSSDGHNMLLYPWFRDFAEHPDKFVEHGHRLAGVFIGCVSVVLAAVAWLRGTRFDRSFTAIIVASVIAQGGLGGARVLFDRQSLAMTHSLTGAVFFALCVVYRLMCSRKWQMSKRQADRTMTPVAAACVVLAPLVVLGQYVLGGVLRHFHSLRHEHIAGAVIASVFCVVSASVLLRSGISLLRQAGLAILVFLGVQLMLGVGAFATRFGIQSVGFVATSGAPVQTVVCSLHTVVGMLLLTSTALSAVATLLLMKGGSLRGLRLREVSIVGREATR